MRKYRMKPSALYIIIAGVFMLAGAGTFLAVKYLDFLQILMYVLIGLFAGAALLFGVVLLPMYFRRTVIFLSDTEVTLHTGLIFLRREQMRLSAVQYVTRVAFPLGGLSGFNFVILRGLGANVILPFLASADAEEIAEAVERIVGGDEQGENVD